MIHIHPGASAIYDSMVLYRNVLAEGVLTSTVPVKAGGNVNNMLGPQTFDFWEPDRFADSMGAACELTQPMTADCAAIIGHNLATVGAQVAIQHKLTDGNWTDPLTARLNPDTNDDILFLFPERTSTAYRVWITIPAGVTPPVSPVISIAMIGQRLLIPDGITEGYTPLNLARQVDLQPNITRGGQFLGNRVQRVGAGTSISLAQQERHWIENDAQDFIAHYNAGKPFIWASCPEFLPNDMAYCWRSGGVLSASYGQGAIYGEMSMEVQAYVG